MKEDQKCKKKIFGAFSSPGHHFVENALFTPIPPFWGDVGVKKWSQILDLGT